MKRTTKRAAAILVLALAAIAALAAAGPDQETVGCMTDLECELIYGPEEAE